MNWGEFANISTALSILIATAAMIIERRRERKRASEEAFLSTNEAWIDLLKTLIDHPDLVLDFGPAAGEMPLQKKQQIMHCHILFSTLELAFLKYQNLPTKTIEEQWRGWEKYIGELFRKPEMLDIWEKHLNDQYDVGFMKHMQKLIGKN